MINKQELWKMKNDDMIALLVEHKIDFDPDHFSRKDAVDRLVEALAAAGDLEVAVEVDDEGNITPPIIKHEYVDIVFRNQDDQPKYVFLGHQGRFLYLPRECLCRIPSEFLDVVRHAHTEKVVQFEKDGKLHHRVVRTPRLVYEVIDKGVI